MRSRFALALILLTGALLAAPAGAAEIADVTVTPTEPIPGTAIALTFELRNPDNRPLSTGYVDVRFREKSIGTITTPAVPAGGRMRLSGGVTLPDVSDKAIRLVLVAPGGRTATPVTLTLTPR
ncbi:MAG TPA: hypothetical protein VGT02_09325 [Methylomirabilota bacterium]|nr:hypothetical protein [Methylomirabilota bacterium]